MGQLKWLAPKIPYPKAGGVRLENKYYEVILKTLLDNSEDNQVRIVDQVKRIGELKTGPKNRTEYADPFDFTQTTTLEQR